MKCATGSFMMSLVAITTLISLNKRLNATIVSRRFVFRANFRDPQTIFVSGLQIAS